MTEIETTAEHFKALQALADTNLKISDARNTLTKLEAVETEYLVSREKKAMLRIEEQLQDSKSLLDEISTNYELVNDFSRNVGESAKFLEEAYKRFVSVTDAFAEKQELWEKDCKEQEEKLQNLRQQAKVDSIRIRDENMGIEAKKRELKTIERKLADERGTLDRAITRLKEGRI